MPLLGLGLLKHGISPMEAVQQPQQSVTLVGPVHVVEHDFLCQSEDCQLQEDPVEVGSSQRRGSPHNLNRG